MNDRDGYAGPQDAGVDEFVGLPFGHTPEDRARTRALLHAYPSDPRES